MEEFRPFTVERLTATKLIVRGGVWEWYDGDNRRQSTLTADGGASLDPSKYKTISDTLSASTAYSVYLELNTSTYALTANLVETSSYPADEKGKLRMLLITFESDAAAHLPDLDANQRGWWHRVDRWNEIADAEDDTTIHPDTDDTHSLKIGEDLIEWTDIGINAVDTVAVSVGASGSITLTTNTGSVITIDSGTVYISNLPTISSGLGAGALYTQTVAQIIGSGTDARKVLCVA